MAQVPSTSGVSDVTPATSVPQDYIRVQPNADAFGGAQAKAQEAIGVGEQKLGAGAVKAGQFFGEVAASDANNNFMDSAQKILDSYTQTKGRDALDARQKAEDDLKNLFDKTSSQMATPEQQQYFNEYSRRYRSIIAGRIGEHASQQADVWYNEVENSGIDQGQKLIANADPKSATYQDTVNAGTAMSLQYTLRQVQRQLGTLPPDQDANTVLNDRLSKVRALSVKTQVEALMPTNPALAQQILENNRATAGPYYEQLSSALKEKVNKQDAVGLVNQVTNGVVNDLSNPTVLDTLHNAFMQQESGSGPGGTAGQGINPGQVQPNTFRLFAQPNERYGDPNAMRAVAYRALDKYAQQYQGDTSRVAVAYFSGPGNVAPLGSPTPWLRDVSDANGKSVSSYVQDIDNRMGQLSPTGFKANAYQRILDATRDNPQLRQDALTEFNQRFQASQIAALSDEKASKDARDQAANSIVQRILKGDPNDKTILSDIQSNPSLDWETRTRLADIAESHLKNDVYAASKTYGPGFWDAYRQVTAPQGDPTRITDPGQVLRMAGPQPGGGDPPLTLAGVAALNKIIEDKKTPEGEGEAALQRQFFETAKQELSGTNPGTNIRDPKGDLIFLKFMQQALPILEKGKAEGESMSELTDMNGPLGKLMTSMKRPMAQYLADTMVDYGPALPPATKRTLSAIIADVQSGKMTSADGKAEALKLGLVAPDAPPAPAMPAPPNVPLVGAPGATP
jgi:hypothetical protein